jgi:muramoyltetrapeptide carboxypeptidase
MVKEWLRLKEGDIIDVIAPASAPKGSQQHKSIEAAKNFITKLGYIPRIREDIFDVDVFCANTVNYRSEALIEAICSDSKAIWCIRGGYGSAMLIPALQELEVPENAKAFIGFSDITALHLFLHKEWGWATIHGRVLNQFTEGKVIEEDAVNEFKSLLSGADNRIKLKLEPLNSDAKAGGIIKAVLTGGNLSLLQTSIGTNWQVNTADKILFIEEVGERGYQLDRMLMHLSQAGLFENVKALILGDIICKKEPDGTDLCEHAIEKFIKTMDIPVFSLPGVGHGDSNHLLPLNTASVIVLGDSPYLECSPGNL